MKLAAFAIAALVSSTCVAQTFGLHIGSRHYPAQHFNNSNPGAYVRFDNGATFGAYRNSFDRTSAYAAFTYEYGWLALTGGLITGYEYPVMLAPSIKIPVLDTYAVRFVVLPKVEKRGSTVVHLTLEAKF